MWGLNWPQWWWSNKKEGNFEFDFFFEKKNLFQFCIFWESFDCENGSFADFLRIFKNYFCFENYVNVLIWKMFCFCRLWEYFADSGTPRWRDAAGIWLNVVVLLSPGAFHHHHHHHHHHSFSYQHYCAHHSQLVIYIALRDPPKQSSQCKDAWIRGLPATNSIPVRKGKSLELHKLSKYTTKSQIESRLCRVFPHLGLGDSHWVSPISGKGSSQTILCFFRTKSYLGGGEVRRPILHRFRFRLSTSSSFSLEFWEEKYVFLQCVTLICRYASDIQSACCSTSLLQSCPKCNNDNDIDNCTWMAWLPKHVMFWPKVLNKGGGAVF